MQLPEVREIELNRWYVCLIDKSEELCKVVRTLYTDNSGVTVICYKVVCYYTCKDLFYGKLNECRQWLREHILIRR